MGAPVHTTRLGFMWNSTCDAIMMALKGTPLLNREGEPILHNGELIMLPPTAAHIREARELMALCGIDQEPIEGSAIVEVQKSISHYDDDQNDPFLLEKQ